MAREKALDRKKNHNDRSQDKRKTSALSHITSEAEKTHIKKVLRITGGNRTRAAEVLGISRKTLWEKIKAYDIVY